MRVGRRFSLEKSDMVIYLVETVRLSLKKGAVFHPSREKGAFSSEKRRLNVTG